MAQFLLFLSSWLHILGTFIFIGHYLLLSLVHMQAQTENGLDVRGIRLSKISKPDFGRAILQGIWHIFGALIAD